MTVTFEGTEYLSSSTHPSIPFTLYVHSHHLLLVPRDVPNIHKAFPTSGDRQRRFTLHLSDQTISQYVQEHNNKAPEFDPKLVCFGYEEDEGVVVAALLPGSNTIPYWDFRTMLSGGETVIKKHFTDEVSDPKTGLDLMRWDLQQAA